jgi:hypothetical protein
MSETDPKSENPGSSVIPKVEKEIEQMIFEKGYDRTFDIINRGVSMDGNIEVRISDDISLEEIEYYNNVFDHQITDIIAKSKYSVTIRIDVKNH